MCMSKYTRGQSHCSQQFVVFVFTPNGIVYNRSANNELCIFFVRVASVKGFMALSSAEPSTAQK